MPSPTAILLACGIIAVALIVLAICIAIDARIKYNRTPHARTMRRIRNRAQLTRAIQRQHAQRYGRA